MKRVCEYPDQLAKYFVVDIQVRASDGTLVLYIPRDKLSNENKQGSVTRRQIGLLCSRLAGKYNIEVTTVYLTSKKDEALEAGLLQILNGRFHGEIKELYLNIDSNNLVSIWVQVASNALSKKRDIESTIHKVLEISKLKAKTIYWIDDSPLIPTIFVLLKTIKQFQPLTTVKLVSILQDEYPDVEENWLNKSLNVLIKKNMVIREHPSGNYILTSAGLQIVPAIKSRNGTDIVRALELGGKKW